MPGGFAAEVAVPAWAKFMKAATRNDKPEWLVVPAGVTTAKVCRLSGLLATDGCQDVEVVTNAGLIERRSMVYTEYFAKGTAPSAYCDQHPTRGIMTKLAGIFGGGEERPAPPRIEDTGIAPTATATSGTRPDGIDPPPPAPTPNRRGFWSRIFRRGGDPPPPPDEQAPPKKKGG
jgi:hypothetical protein